MVAVCSSAAGEDSPGSAVASGSNTMAPAAARHVAHASLASLADEAARGVAGRGVAGVLVAAAAPKTGNTPEYNSGSRGCAVAPA